jgi:D-glycero-D-manno-heptose 1,7-bisphosphate phosphatase
MSNCSGLRRTAFIDRDGVNNEEGDYVCRIEDFRLLPGVIEGLAHMRDAAFALVTNQSGIGRGVFWQIS